MRIRKITTIKKYKSFLDFSWSKFCENKDKEKVLGKFSIIFGENGAGKSTICDVLKSVSGNQDFQNTQPDIAEIKIEKANGNGLKTYEYKYEKGNWEKQIEKNSFLFFDVDFINANVHTHGSISKNQTQGAHTQNAGKLIISLDENAHTLQGNLRDKQTNYESQKTTERDILNKTFTDQDRDFFNAYKDIRDEDKEKCISDTEKKSKKHTRELESLNKLNDNHSKINSIHSVAQQDALPPLSSEDTFTELFACQIKENTQNDVDNAIKDHFAKHKQFIEQAKDQIPRDYKDKNCPLCMQPLVNAQEVIKYYRTAFNETYENAKNKFLDNIKTIKNELEAIKLTLSSLSSGVTKVFDALEKINTDFEIQDIYKLEEKTKYVENFNNIPIQETDELLTALESLKKIDRGEVDVPKLYEAVADRLGEVKKSVDGVNKLIVAKNELINSFKKKYADKNTIEEGIGTNKNENKELNCKIDFLNSEKIQEIKNQKAVNEELETLSKKIKESKNELKTHLTHIVPKKIILEMEKTLKKFNLNLTLEYEDSSMKTKGYSFSFKIKDQGKKREMKNDLSESERQIISLAFFFAINENMENKDKTVLIFDDPVTSLDSSNLKILAELIHEETQKFSQIIIFTHHRLFFKYLAKCVAINPCKFGVLKNTDQSGGSFMFFDPGFDLIQELKKCNSKIKEDAIKGKLKLELITIEYGQLLRLAVERFIKNDLLMWDKERTFGELIKGLKQTKNKMRNLCDNDLEVIKNIYNYCNHSNIMHADKEALSSLSELRGQICKFVKIMKKEKRIRCPQHTTLLKNQYPH